MYGDWANDPRMNRRPDYLKEVVVFCTHNYLNGYKDWCWDVRESVGAWDRLWEFLDDDEAAAIGETEARDLDYMF